MLRISRAGPWCPKRLGSAHVGGERGRTMLPSSLRSSVRTANPHKACRVSEPSYLAVNRDAWTKANAEYTDRAAHDAWAQEHIHWGTTQALESDVNVLPDVARKNVVELGCGTGYFGAWLARRGARVVGVDVTPAQLDTARRMEAQFALGLEFVEANAEETGLPGDSFDLVVSEYGASIWCDPAKWLPEAARLLRDGGHVVFLRNSTLAVLCATAEGSESETLQRPQRGLYKLEWIEPRPEVEFQPAHGELLGLLRASGFEIEALVELFAAEDAVAHEYYSMSLDWAKKWPSEEIWRARLQRR
jgi:SAM-dependent methyltransferase